MTKPLRLFIEGICSKSDLVLVHEGVYHDQYSPSSPSDTTINTHRYPQAAVSLWLATLCHATAKVLLGLLQGLPNFSECLFKSLAEARDRRGGPPLVVGEGWWIRLGCYWLVLGDW